MRAILTLIAFVALTVQAAPKPNVVLIFIDDMGYGDIGPFGNKVNKTPHLDRMAKEGLKLTQFYVSNTACTPSRSALMTGTYAHRIGMDGRVVFPGEKRGLNPKEITIAELLKKQGYVTGCFGKWHLGDQPIFLPLAQDISIKNPNSIPNPLEVCKNLIGRHLRGITKLKYLSFTNIISNKTYNWYRMNFNIISTIKSISTIGTIGNN